MFIWWGPSLIQFYNDAYSVSIGSERNPSALGQEGQKCWKEIWPIMGPQIEHVMRGRGATWHENALVPITRNGHMEDVYWTYSYNPIFDSTAAAGVGGVLVVCTETTEMVQAARRALDEKKRFQSAVEQAPAFMALLSGPEHKFEFANPAYMDLVQHRWVIGNTVAEALPEVVEQGYLDLLNDAYRSGKTVTARDSPVWFTDANRSGATRQRFIDFAYRPVREIDGAVKGIFVQGIDSTERKVAEDILRDTITTLTRVFSLQSDLVRSLKG